MEKVVPGEGERPRGNVRSTCIVILLAILAYIYRITEGAGRETERERERQRASRTKD